MINLNPRKKTGLLLFGFAMTAIFAVISISRSVQAFSTTATVKVKVLAPPCIVNGNRDIPIDFGNDIIVSRIDSRIYERSIPYVLDCSAGTSKALKMQIRGGGASFDTTVLGTSKANLAIELKSNGSKMAINSWHNFTDPARPSLSAVVIKNRSGSVTGGYFTATSTLLVDYQ
ncbi:MULTISPECIES: fimbrial protein [unclassified Pantoea]|uniref:fimbrial protein n=1 Tax=unclassified Pantoea TaxID=2630326 RepID=UPI001CD564C2|nr:MULTISPECIES: fimbrial protein [unclassified Pantoea]MCA1178309.1 fimbrial protein [Pantoea sp. alder69]MCA1253218.1 fimbrial protein [Pantoea sp. alder70]MCA1266595.1 fimbrial protein [Pantoea sp. alder81]